MSSLPDTPFSLQGGCLCRSVRYTIQIPSRGKRLQLDGTIPPADDTKAVGKPRLPFIMSCHCTSCRVSSGGLIAGWLFVPRAWVEFHLRSGPSTTTTADTAPRKTVSGPEALSPPSARVLEGTDFKEYHSSPDVSRTFCGNCGTSLTYVVDDDPAKVDIGLGSLDRESLELDGFALDGQGHWSDGISWVKRLSRHGDGGIPIHVRGSSSELAED